MWTQIRRLFDHIDLTKEKDAVDLSGRFLALRASLDLNALAEETEDKVCPEKRRYSKGNRMLTPFGCHHPSEAMVLAISNVSRGRLLKKADDPGFIYDYDEAGRIIKIAQMHDYEGLKGKPCMVSYCLYGETEEVYLSMRCSRGTYGETLEQPKIKLYRITIVYRRPDGTPERICCSDFSLDGIRGMTEVEVYGSVEGNRQSMDRYVLLTDMKAAGSSIIVCHMQIDYDEQGKMKDCIVLDEERLSFCEEVSQMPDFKAMAAQKSGAPEGMR